MLLSSRRRGPDWVTGRRPLANGSAPSRSAADQRTAALAERTERFRRRDGRAQLVVVPDVLRLVGPLHLKQEHVVDLATVRADTALAEQWIVGRQLLHLRNHRLAVGGAADRDHRLEVVR